MSPKQVLVLMGRGKGTSGSAGVTYYYSLHGADKMVAAFFDQLAELMR